MANTAKRARYDGPFDEVKVTWPPGETNVGAEGYREFKVKRGAQLDADAPAALRDELIQSADWSEVGGSNTKNEE